MPAGRRAFRHNIWAEVPSGVLTPEGSLEIPCSMDRLTGIHAVREALEANRPLDSLIVARGTHGNRIEELVRLARQHDVPVRFEERIQVDRAAGTREHQGVVALVAASQTASF